MDKETIDEIEAEIMENIYELISLNFDGAVLIADATQIVREPLEKLLQSQSQTQDIKKKVEGKEIIFVLGQKKTYYERGYNKALSDIIKMIQ